MTFLPKLFLDIEADSSSRRLPLDLSSSQTVELGVGGSHFRVFLDVPSERRHFTLEALSGEGKLFATLCFQFREWSSRNYLLLPGAVYGGNRVNIVAQDSVYPPMLPEDYTCLNPPQLTGVIQHLAPQGGGRLEETSAEGAFPGVGYFDAATQRAVWLLTPQGNEVGNYGYSVIEDGDVLEVRLSSPVHRKFRQSGCNSIVPADDAPLTYQTGTIITFEFDLRDESCTALGDFFRQARELRNAVVPSGIFPNLLPYSEATRLVRERLETDNWWEEYGYYSIITKTDLKGCCRNCRQHWQLGWVGGIMNNEYLLREGNHPERVLRELHTVVTKAQQPSGFFLTSAHMGEFFPDVPAEDGRPPRRECLVRKNADGLAFLCRQLLWLRNAGKPIDQPLLDGARKCAEAFQRLWEKHGQFGYFIDPVTGELLVGGGVGGAPAITGLALASELFHEPEFLAIAKAAACHYAETYLHKKGNVYGGVDDALQATDSESAYLLLEALMTVWEYTHDETLLALAETTGDYLSTWIISYDYRFPPQSTFGKLDMHTAGVVYANIQNRHGGPGFCSTSGDALFKLYRATGRSEYGRLAREVVHALPQFLSRPGRVIRGMEVVGISERVNLGDWEGRDQVGEIDYCPCACYSETALLLARVHLPGIYVRTDTRENLCFDHLETVWEGDDLRITNPTDFPAEATLLVEDGEAARQPLFTNAYERFRKFAISPHSATMVRLKGL